jgi:Predicted RNA-binding protein homologous to eukaryotic snRNP
MLMKIEIDFTKSAQQNADRYYKMSKVAKKKTEGALAAIIEMEGRKKHAEKNVKKKELKEKREQKWYERFNWFFASDGSLVIGGRSAKQNEEINAKHFENGDLFFHADVFGASVTILKKGESSSSEVREEAAAFAGAFSKAWESGASTVNVYALKRVRSQSQRRRALLARAVFCYPARGSGTRTWH